MANLRTGKDAIAFVRRHRLVPMTPVDGFPSLVGEIAGGPVRGSWWGHPKGALMYDLANVLHNSSDVLAVKLVEGKVTFIHRALWPSLYRLVSDPGWRRARERRLGALEKRILAAVEASGQAEAEKLAFRWEITRKADRKKFKKAIDTLAQAMCLLTSSFHTDQGHHATILTAWSAWAQSPTRAAARRLPREEALEALRGACRGNLYGLTQS
jgi:hypothetical protein